MIRTYENPIIISFSCKWIYCNQNSWIFIIIFSINEPQNNQAINNQLLNVYDWFNCSLQSLFDLNHYYIGRSFISIKVVEIKYFFTLYQHNITFYFIFLSSLRYHSTFLCVVIYKYILYTTYISTLLHQFQSQKKLICFPFLLSFFLLVDMIWMIEYYSHFNFLHFDYCLLMFFLQHISTDDL